MSTVKTTIKTDVCSFSEFRIYPGRGKKFISRDGKVHIFIGSKTASLARQKLKPVKLTWTQGWRRMNKKGRIEATSRRRGRRTARVQKAIVGLTLEDIKKKRAERPDLRKSARDAAIKEAKEKVGARPTAKPSKGESKAAKTQQKATQPKMQKAPMPARGKK
eukprot:GHVT01070357.1.p1 GENE.GHVT01070357.1~~GHVT01070357.1.p1  ORF type:complete len:162 (+),score=32.73 GHVT01070357.1:495-980(+)